jgi:hypothetical protein
VATVNATPLVELPEADLTGQSSPIFEGAEFRGVGEYFDETAGDASEKAAWGVVGEAAAKHLQNVLGGLDRVDQASQIRTRWGSGGDGP